MNDFSYRVAVAEDVAGILSVFAEVASEVPTRVYEYKKGDHTDTKESIEGSVGIGRSWVATDVSGTIVGYALAEGDDEALTLFYLGVSKAARREKVCSSLISRLKESSAAINTDVRSNNKSSMVDIFEHLGFVKGNVNESRTKLHWKKPTT
jgi:ribosomal protein S18 acetylase RimI-like enzyme